jgi:hypothetical protein
MFGSSPVLPATSFDRHVVVVKARRVLLGLLLDLIALATDRIGRARALDADMVQCRLWVICRRGGSCGRRRRDNFSKPTQVNARLRRSWS